MNFAIGMLMVIQAISPFIPAATKKKVVMAKGSLEDKRKLLTQYVAPEQLEEDYGGQVPSAFNFDECVSLLLL
jgi:hypothetical protein